MKKRTNEEFLLEINKMNPTYSVLSEYINCDTNIHCFCNIHYVDFYSTPYNLLKGKCGCEACRRDKIGNKNRRTKSEFIDKLKQVNENIEVESVTPVQPKENIYKVFIGTYTSAEQAKVAKDIIAESGSNLNPIVKCIGSNNYTLQVGIFKSKSSAEALLYTINQNNLPGRIVQEY